MRIKKIGHDSHFLSNKDIEEFVISGSQLFKCLSSRRYSARRPHISVDVKDRGCRQYTVNLAFIHHLIYLEKSVKTDFRSRSFIQYY